MIERSGHVSYANCGLPYYVGSVIEDREDLVLQTPERLQARFRLDVRVNAEVVSIDRERREVRVRSVETGEASVLPYDTLILSPGAVPIRPSIPGADRMRVLRTVEDAERLASEVTTRPRSAIVVGAGFVGLETAENLAHHGIPVTVVEARSQVLPVLDPELAIAIEETLERHGVRVITGAGVAEVHAWGVTLDDGQEVEGDLVVAAVGVRPDVRLARAAGLELGPHGGILVDETSRTSDPAIYAVGDAVEKVDAISGSLELVTLAHVANRQGRRVADHICGRAVEARPSIGTAIVRIFDTVAASTGLSEQRLRALGRAYQVVRAHPMSHASYYPGAQPMSLKVMFDPSDGRILGAQAVGGEGVDKRIDVLATAIAAGLPVDELANLELAYAPPFSSAKDPVNMVGYIAENIRSGTCDVVEPEEVESLVRDGWTLLDVRTAEEHRHGAIPGSVSVPVDELREHLESLGDGPFVVYCAVGLRGHVATTALLEHGFKARNLNGGHRSWAAWKAAERMALAG